MTLAPGSPGLSEPGASVAPGRGASADLRDPHRVRRAGPRLREHVVLLGYRVGTAVLGRLPLRPSAAIGGWFAVLAYYLWPAKRRIVRANASHILGVDPDDPAVGRHARAVFRNQVRWILEAMRIGRISRQELLARVDVDAYDRLQATFDASPGLIVVGAHLGNGEMGAAAIAGRGLPLRLLTDDTAYEGLYEAMAARRRAWGVEMVRWRNLRDVYRVLRAHEALALLVDWGYRPDGIPVRLFGAWTTLPAGPAVLAGRTGARIVVAWVIRRPDGTFEGGVGTPIHVTSTEPAELARASQAVADDLERAVRQAPDQWTTFKPIWPPDPAEAGRLAALHDQQTGMGAG